MCYPPPQKKSDTLAEVVNFTFFKIIPIVNRIFLLHTETCTVKLNIITSLLIHYSVCVLNFMFPACRPNFAEVARTTQTAEQA